VRNFLIGTMIFWVVVSAMIIKEDRDDVSHATSSSSKERVEIVFWHGMGGPLGIVMDDLIKRYNTSQSRYIVKGVAMGSYDTLQKKLLASLVAKSAPDISQNYETLTKKFIKHRKIVCLDTILASESEDIKADIIPILLENNTFNGKLWSFPFNKSVPVMYYNKELFRKAGLDPEAPPKTFDELASYARHLTKVLNSPPGNMKIYGYATGKGNVWMFTCRVLQMGGRIPTEEDRRSYFSEPPAVKAVEYIQNMVKEGIAAEGQGYDHQNDFKAQRAVIIDNSIVSKVHMESGIKFDYGIAPLPSGATAAVILAGTNINIFDNGDPERIKGAWDFVKWFTSTEIGAEWAIRTTYMPVRKSSLRTKLMQDALSKDPNLRAPYAELDYCHFEPRLGCWFEIRDLMTDYLEKSTLEMGSAQEYMNEMSRDIDGILRHVTD